MNVLKNAAALVIDRLHLVFNRISVYFWHKVEQLLALETDPQTPALKDAQGDSEHIHRTSHRSG